MKRFIAVPCLKGSSTGLFVPLFLAYSIGESDRNHIFMGTDLCNAPRRLSVHKTHLKFSRRDRKVPAPVSVDSASRAEPSRAGGSATGVVIGNIYRILQ